MKNNLFNGNLFKVSLLLLGVTFLFIQGCRKDKTSLNDSELIRKAKNWIQTKPGISINPDWALAKVDRLNDKIIVSLPIETSMTTDENNIQSILLIDVSESNVKGNIIEIISPNSISVGNSIKISMDYFINKEKAVFDQEMNFRILSFDIQRSFLRGNYILGGEQLAAIYLKTKSPSSAKLMGDRNSTKKEKTCDDYYYVLRNGNGSVVGMTYLFFSL